MTTQVEPIRGKVANLLNDREVALNRGSLQGVKLRMKFNILRSEAHEVTDPDTGEALGSYQPVKVCVRVKSVYDKWSVAETFNIRRVNVGGFGIFNTPKWEERYETLKLQDASVNEIDDSGSFVKTGDPVVQVIELSNPNESQ